MTITGRNNSPSDSDLHQKPLSRRLPRRRSTARRRRSGVPAVKWSRPGTPLVPWKFENGANADSPEVGREIHRRVISARELGGVVWRLQLSETDPGVRRIMAEEDPDGATDVGLTFLGPQKSKAHGYGVKELMQSPPSVTGPRNGHRCKLKPLFEFPNSVLEGATKWNPVNAKTSNKARHDYGHSSYQSHQFHDNSAISKMNFEVEKARECIYELEAEERSSKKKLKHLLKKLSEERAAWRRREHEKIRAIIDDAKADLKNERKNRQTLEIVNSKLVNEVADAKLLAKHYTRDYEKERKAKELTAEVCDELAKEIGKDKSEVEALKRESMKLREEVDDEREMLQMAEVWRRERVQMKLVDAKAMIEERYAYMNNLVVDLEAFISTRSSISDVEDIIQAEIFQQPASLVNVQDLKEFMSDPSNPDDIFYGDAFETETEPCKKMFNKDKVIHRSGELEESESGWETGSQVEDQGSTHSPEGSNPSVNKNFRETNGSEGTPVTEVSEVCSAPKTHNKKVSAIARLWRSGSNNGENFKIISVDGMNGRFSDSRLSNGCIEKPLGTQQSGLKTRLVEARLDCQKIQLKQVLKQKI